MADPSQVFATARAAAQSQDWDTLFRCLHRKSVLTIAANGAQWLAQQEGSEIADRFGFDGREVRRLAEEMSASAARLLSLEGEEQRAASQRHRSLVHEHEAALRRSVEAVDDLPGFAAALERGIRSAVGGGSVSSSLFGNEELEDVVVDGDRARAAARHTGGTTREVRFTRSRRGWQIHL